MAHTAAEIPPARLRERDVGRVPRHPEDGINGLPARAAIGGGGAGFIRQGIRQQGIRQQGIRQQAQQLLLEQKEN